MALLVFGNSCSFWLDSYSLEVSTHSRGEKRHRYTLYSVVAAEPEKWLHTHEYMLGACDDVWAEGQQATTGKCIHMESTKKTLLLKMKGVDPYKLY